MSSRVSGRLLKTLLVAFVWVAALKPNDTHSAESLRGSLASGKAISPPATKSLPQPINDEIKVIVFLEKDVDSAMDVTEVQAFKNAIKNNRKFANIVVERRYVILDDLLSCVTKNKALADQLDGLDSKFTYSKIAKALKSLIHVRTTFEAIKNKNSESFKLQAVGYLALRTLHLDSYNAALVICARGKGGAAIQYPVLANFVVTTDRIEKIQVKNVTSITKSTDILGVFKGIARTFKFAKQNGFTHLRGDTKDELSYDEAIAHLRGPSDIISVYYKEIQGTNPPPSQLADTLIHEIGHWFKVAHPAMAPRFLNTKVRKQLYSGKKFKALCESFVVVSGKSYAIKDIDFDIGGVTDTPTIIGPNTLHPLIPKNKHGYNCTEIQIKKLKAVGIVDSNFDTPAGNYMMHNPVLFFSQTHSQRAVFLKNLQAAKKTARK